MNNHDKINELIEDFRNSGYTKAEVELLPSVTKSDTVIDLQSTGVNSYSYSSACLSNPVPFNSIPYVHNFPSPSINYTQRFSLEDLTRFKCCWKKTSTNTDKNNKDGIELTSPPAFSEEFRRALGEKNTSNIQEIDAEYLKNIIFIGFLEQESYRQCINKSNQIIEGLLSIQAPNGYVRWSVDNNTFSWVIGYGEMKEHGFVALIQALLTIPYLDAAATLANILGVDINNFYFVFKMDARIAETKDGECSEDNIFQYIPIQDSEKSVVRLIDIIKIYGHSKQVIGAILMYKFNNIKLCIPATVVRGQLSIGKHKPSAYFLNQDKIDQNPNCIIILCQDIRLAIALDKKVQESQILDDSHVVVTGHIGTDLSVLPWNYFYGHQVILICALSKQSFSAVKVYKENLENAAAVDFKIYPYPLLHIAPLTGNSTKSFISDSLEEELYQEKIILSSVESISDLLHKIEEKAMKYEPFVKWGKNKGLFTTPKCDKTESQLALPTFTLVDSGKAVESIKDVGVLQVFPPDGLVSSHGKKDAGKSYYNLTIIIALITSSECVGLKANYNNTLKCLLVDSETPPQNLSQRIRQFGLEKFLDDKSFHVISILASDSSSPWANFDLSREEHRQMLEAYCQQNNIKYMFLDNLTTLTRGGVTYNPIKMCVIFEWMEQVRRKGIGVYLTHHTLDVKGRNSVDSKARGSDELSIRSHTEIIIIGKKEIANNEIYRNIVGTYYSKPGIVLGLYFKVCKAAGIITGMIRWIHLPYNGNAWTVIDSTDNEGISMIEENEVQDANSNGDAIMDSNLSPDASKLLKHISETKTLSRNDAEAYLDCAEDKARKVLKELMDNKCINFIDKGRSSYYKLI